MNVVKRCKHTDEILDTVGYCVCFNAGGNSDPALHNGSEQTVGMCPSEVLHYLTVWTMMTFLL